MRRPSALATFASLTLSALLLTNGPASAHFLQIIPSEDVLPEGGTVLVDMLFTHPFEGGPIMTMERPERLGMLKNGEIIDLLPDIAKNPSGGGEGWTVSRELAEPGASVFFVDPAPYWEPAEGKFIKHYAKVVVDNYASGEGWDAMVGLPVEIRPLTRPTGLWTGNLFSGVVMKGEAPVPFAEIEVEFINDGSIQAPNEAFITQVIMADANGTFSYAMPHAGWWGFAALVTGEASMTAPDGKAVPVEEGGLIWVRAQDSASAQQ
ncbi:DUF4198 domain-containing protein [Breoghania sp.]|uniref:DUF4198 domain-containing protein n=1 Tax=Breoghania sp. TaxID=2065378 RepID=UPI002AA667B3|nr:DUF4198 domain-containing protein [Breoghania sp.]